MDYDDAPADPADDNEPAFVDLFEHTHGVLLLGCCPAPSWGRAGRD